MPSINHTVTRQTILQLAGKVVSTALGLLAFGLLTRSLPLAEGGWYITATGFLQFIGIASDFGFTLVTSNLLSEPGHDDQAILGTVMSWRLIIAVVINGLGPLMILLFPYPPAIRLAVAILSVSYFLNNVSEVFVGYFRQRLKVMVTVISDLVGRIVFVLGIIFLRAQGFLPLMSAITLGTLAATIYLYWNMEPIRLRFDKAVGKKLFYKMWPTALSIIFNACYLEADRIILPLFAPQTTVAWYGASYRVLDVVIQVSSLIMGLVMPLVTYAWSRGDRAAFKERYQLGFDLLCALILPMAAGLAALSVPIMRFIAGDNYAEAGNFLRYLALSIIGTCFGQIFGHLALAINRQKESLYVFASDALISVPLYVITIRRFGVYGAIGTTLFSELYAGIFLTILTVYYSKTFPHLGLFGKILAACLAMDAVLFCLPHLALLAAVPLGVLVYVVALILFGAVTPASIKEVLSLKKVVAAP